MGEEQKVRFETHTQGEALEMMRGGSQVAEPTGPIEPSGPKPAEPGKQDEPDYKSRITALETELAESKKNRSLNVKNPLYQKLQVIEDESPDEVPIYQELMFGKPDSVKLWKIGFVREHPQFKERPEDVQLLLEDKHPILFDPNADKDSKEFKTAQMKFDLEVSSIKKTFDERLDKIAIADPEKAQKDNQEVIGKLAESWKPEFITLKDGFAKLKIDATLKDNIVENFEIEVPLEEQRKYMEEAALFMMHNKLAKTPENIQKVKDYMESRYFSDHRKEIISTILQTAITKRETELAKHTHNPHPITQRQTPPGKTVNSQEEFVANITKKR